MEASISALLVGTRKFVIMEANCSAKVLGDMMMKLTEEAYKFKCLEKEKMVEFGLRIRELEKNVDEVMARARVLNKDVAVAVTDQVKLNAADRIDTIEKARVLDEEAAVAIMDQGRWTAANGVVAA